VGVAVGGEALAEAGGGCEGSCEVVVILRGGGVVVVVLVFVVGGERHLSSPVII
jgi:hypothetical protein